MAKEKVKQLKKDTQSRAWCLCFHNLEETGFDIKRIQEILKSIPSLSYYCISKEKGVESGKIHIHCYFYCKNAIKFSTLINSKFLGADVSIEMAKGTAEENREYVFKTGKWLNDKKADQRIDGEQFEWGELPKSKKGNRTDLEILYDLIKEGLSNAQILEQNPDYMRYLNHIDRTRQAIRDEAFKGVWRDIECIYVFGITGSGKTRTYMEKYGYENVYRITNYNPNAIWDGYKGQDCIILEEFRSQVTLSELLTYLEGYPNSSLRARYADKVASYTKVIFITNISLEKQYPNIQDESPETWQAFLRRIKKVIHYVSKDEIITYNSVEEYLHRNESFHKVTFSEKTPFDADDKKDNDTEKYEQDKLPFE